MHSFEGPDGSMVHFSAWTMVQKGVRPFQEVGIELAYPLPLTIEGLREHGFKSAQKRVQRARFAQALELLGAPADGLEALLRMAD